MFNELITFKHCPLVSNLLSKCHEKLAFFRRSAENYGLTLILGGAEVSLWDIVHLYSGWARQLDLLSEQRYNPDSDEWIRDSCLSLSYRYNT